MASVESIVRGMTVPSPPPPATATTMQWCSDSNDTHIRNSDSSDSDDDSSLPLDALLAFCEGRTTAAADSFASCDDSSNNNNNTRSEMDIYNYGDIPYDEGDTLQLHALSPASPGTDTASLGSPTSTTPSKSPQPSRLSVDPLLLTLLPHTCMQLDSNGFEPEPEQQASPQRDTQILNARTPEPTAVVTASPATASNSSCSIVPPATDAAAAPVDPQLQEQQRLRAIRLGKRQRQRQQQRDELKCLALRVTELERELAQLHVQREAFASDTADAAARLALATHTAGASIAAPTVWTATALLERQALQTARMENRRLRAQFECQLQIARGLQRLYETHGSLAALETSPDVGFLPKKPRVVGISDDTDVFATLGQHLDAQYAQVDALLATHDLATFDGERSDEMRLCRDATSGSLCFDNVYSKVFPFEVNAIGDVLWQTLTVPQLQSFHGSYAVVFASDDVVHTKVVNTIALPLPSCRQHTQEETSTTAQTTDITLVMRIVTKRFREHGRSTSVWEGLIEVAGAMSVRLRETGWNVLRPAHVLQPGQRGPVTIEQACVRITPELQHPTTQQTPPSSLEVGGLIHLLVRSYHRHMELVHVVADDLLAMQLDNVAL